MMKSQPLSLAPTSYMLLSLTSPADACFFSPVEFCSSKPRCHQMRKPHIFHRQQVTSLFRNLYVDDKSGGPGSSDEGLPPEKLRNELPDVTIFSAETDLLPANKIPSPKTQIDLDEVDTKLEKPHSVWYKRFTEYSSHSDLYDYDFVLNDKELIESDPALNLLSSEIGVKECFAKKCSPGTVNASKSGLPISVLLERTFDTVEDVWEHLRRMPYENGWAKISPEEELTRKTVVVLGSGWAAHALMKVANTNKLRLIVVSPSNHFVFTPMLASASVGTVEYRSMTESVRSANGMIEEYIEGKAVGLDLERKKVTVKLNSLLKEFREGDPPTLDLEYDHLVVAVGCKVDDKGVPGASKALRLKTCDDARKLRTAVGECFEYASRPDVAGPEHEKERTQRATFLVVGGGPTGVELAGELYDLTQDVTREHKGAYPRLRNNVRVILVHSGSDLVPQFEPPLRAEALKSLRKKGVEVILNTRVSEVGDGFAKISTKVVDEESGKVIGRDESTVAVGLTVWCAGTAPVSFVSQLLDQLPESARSADGKIKVDKWLRPPMKDQSLMGSVLVLGDAAAVDDGNNGLLPQTAQVAGQQGAYVARMLSRGYDLEVTPPALPCTPLADCDVFADEQLIQWLKFRGLDVASQFRFLNLGLLAYLGGGEALSQVQVGDFPLFAYSGSVAFVLWRSVYLVKQVATKNRILVTFDWIKSSIFGRDTTRF